MFIGEDVEAELPRALARVARDAHVTLIDAERALARIVPRMRVVPLRMGDYLNPRIANLRRYDPDLPRAMRGDPDDLGTAAVAAFLAPAVIISKDSVFNRFGLALPADQWTEEASRLLAAAGYDATFAEATATAETAASLLFGGIMTATRAAARNPEAAMVVLVAAGLAGWYSHQRGWISGERLRAAGQLVASAARPLTQRIVDAGVRRNEALAALTVVETLGPPSLEERCARHLARLRTPASPGEIATFLGLAGPAVTPAKVNETITTHPAFTGDDQNGYTLGRPAQILAITGGSFLSDLEPGSIVRSSDPIDRQLGGLRADQAPGDEPYRP